MKRIHEHGDLIKDESSKAVLNIDSSKLLNAKLAKRARLSKLDRLNKVEKDVQEIKELLLQLLKDKS